MSGQHEKNNTSAPNRTNPSRFGLHNCGDETAAHSVTLTQILTEETEDSLVFVVYTNSECGRDTELVLSPNLSADYTNKLETSSFWEINNGSITVKKDLLDPQKELYIYLYDKYFKRRVSNIAAVFSAPLTIKKWLIDNDNTITFCPDRSIWNYAIATDLMISHIDEESPIGLIRENLSALPDTRFDLQKLDCWRDTKKFSFDARLVIDLGDTKVISAPAAALTAFIAPPDVSGIAYRGDTLSAEGSFLSGADVCAGLYAGEVFVTELDALPASGDSIRTYSMDGINLTHDGVFSVRFFYRTERGESLKTPCFTIVTAIPEVTGFRLNKKRGVIMRLAEVYDYELSWRDGEMTVTSRFYGGETLVPRRIREFIVTVVSGVSKGQSVSIVPRYADDK